MESLLRRNTIQILIILMCTINCAAQYEPPAGMPGSSAISATDPAIISWAMHCSVKRGLQDISDPSSGFASAGDSSMACGPALTNGIVSLGDGGSAICRFRLPLKDKPGYDFAVFENSFSDTYLELAFVEVSSDGINFFRFPSHSATDTITQTGPFDTLDCRKIKNLAGKYRGGYGTPFDLNELKNVSGLDIDKITHIKIVDVIGSVNNQYASRDSQKNKVNDPWPTRFPSSGFDLDAIGVMHENEALLDVHESARTTPPLLYPNPACEHDIIKVSPAVKLTIRNATGQTVMSGQAQIDASTLRPGIYFVTFKNGEDSVQQKLIIR
jgi:hypothetical protein